LAPAPQPTPSTDNAATPTIEANPGTTPSNNGRRPTGVKAAKRALTQAELMKRKLKSMESSASDTCKMSRLRHAEMSRANDIKERLVDMDIMSKDLSTCVDE
jgi:hypothetical protein